MAITKTPKIYSSAFKDALFGVSATATETIECDIYDHNSTTIVGRKRFCGSTSYDVNVAPYAQRQLIVEPLYTSECHFVAPARCIVNVTLGIGAARSTTRLNGGMRTIYPYEKLSSSPAQLTIRPDEHDEMAVIGDGGTLRAELLLASGTTVVLAEESCPEGLAVFCLNTTDAESKCGSAGAGSIWTQSSFTVRIVDSSNELLSQQTYLPRPVRSLATRLCWWNNYGQVDYCTMLRIASSEFTFDKAHTLTSSGYKTTGCTREQHVTILSEPVDRATAEWLSGIVSAPRLWIARSISFDEINLLNRSVTLWNDKLVQLTLTARYPMVDTLQHL